MCSHGIHRDTSTAQSCCYEQESESIIFQKLFPLKAHVYILKRCPQALSQNQCIFCYNLFYQTQLTHLTGQNRLKREMLLVIGKGRKGEGIDGKNHKADTEIYRAKQCEDTYFRSQQLHLH